MSQSYFQRGRAHRGGSFNRFGRSWRASSPPPTGELVETISSNSMLKDEAEPPSHIGITGMEFIASYNWLDDSEPKIIIPGKPPLWNPPRTSSQLKQDSGIYYRDRNAAYYPEHPIEPAIVSVMRMHPTPCHLDVFACGSTLGSLLRFVRGDDKPFRMLVEVVAGTVHLVRRENTPKEQLVGVRGYGHTFPEAYTIWEPDVNRSLSHQRILKYRFGGLDMMIRFEGDGYIKSDKSIATTSDGRDLLDQLESLRVEKGGIVKGPEKFEKSLKVENAGVAMDQEAIFDLKTRSINRESEDTLGEELPRLWAAQISNFILAHHHRGLFTNVQVRSVKDKVQDWEARNQPSLHRFLNLLNHIIKTAHSHQRNELEIVRETGGGLEIRKRTSDVGTVFSDPVQQGWAKWLSEETGQAARRSPPNIGGQKEPSGGDDSDEEQDFTACEAECGYCGQCAP